MTSLRIDAYATPVALSASEWDDLRARPPASINGSRAWVMAALATTDRDLRPHFLAVHSESRLVALLSLVLDTRTPVRTVRMVGTPHNNLTDLLVLPGYERAAAIVIGELHGLAADGWAVDLDLVDPVGVLARADAHTAVLEWEPSECAPTIDLRAAWRSAASPRRQRRWDRALSLLRARHVVESRWLEGADVVRALPEFLRVREARLRAKGRPLDGMPISLIDAVVPRLAAVGSCAFADLRIDGNMVARDLYLLDPPVALLWLRALDIGWRRVPCGHLLLRSTALELAADGYDVLDLGTGDEPYKFVFGAQRRALLRASLAAAPSAGRTNP